VDYRVREHLTKAEVDKLLVAPKRSRHGHRDRLIGLLIYRHGLRVSEACDLRWDDIDLGKRTIIAARREGTPGAFSTSPAMPASPTRCDTQPCPRSRSKTSGAREGHKTREADRTGQTDAAKVKAKPHFLPSAFFQTDCWSASPDFVLPCRPTRP
jgi:integrase